MLAPALVLVAIASLPARAHAGNTVHPRTPVLWPEAECIQTVDRSLSSSFEFGYAIPFEDYMLSVDELDDSRRHQFVAFCRQWPAGTAPPPYVSVADLQRAIDEGVETDATLLDDPEATLETSMIWASCWSRVTPDDERRPITFEAAAEPVVWDTSTVAAGTWTIAGYTWEPPQTLWTRAPWVVRVIDDADDDADPALALGPTPETVDAGDSVPVSVCADASADATLRLDWTTTDDDPPLWREGESIALGESSMLELDFTPPPESWGKQLRLRARVEQGDQRSYEAHTLSLLIVFAGSDDTGSDDTGSDATGSDTGSGDDSGEAGETGDGANPSDDSGAAEDRDGEGCRCDASRERGNLLWFVPLVMISLRRRSAEQTSAF